MKVYNIKTDTADSLRAIAPALGLTATTDRVVVAPGVEQMELDPFVALAFERQRKAAKLGVDAMIMRIVRNLANREVDQFVSSRLHQAGVDSIA